MRFPAGSTDATGRVRLSSVTVHRPPRGSTIVFAGGLQFTTIVVTWPSGSLNENFWSTEPDPLALQCVNVVRLPSGSTRAIIRFSSSPLAVEYTKLVTHKAGVTARTRFWFPSTANVQIRPPGSCTRRIIPAPSYANDVRRPNGPTIDWTRFSPASHASVQRTPAWFRTLRSTPLASYRNAVPSCCVSVHPAVVEPTRVFVPGGTGVYVVLVPTWS